MFISSVLPLSLIDYPEHVACTVFTLGCNFRCHYCYNSKFVLPEKVEKIRPYCIPEKYFFNFLNTRHNKLEGVCITGGEPTIHKSLPSFLKRIKDQGFSVKLDTNGSNPKVIEKLIKNKLVDYFAMDIKAHPLDYEDIIDKKGMAKKIEKSKQLIENSKITHEFRTVIIPKFHNKERKKRLLEFVGKNSFHRTLEFTNKNGCLNNNWE